jgi:hypothetical protein
LRQAKKLGFLGVILTLVAAFGVLAGTGLVSAQASKACVGSGTGGTLPPGGADTCTVTATVAIPAGGALIVTPTAPVGSAATMCTSLNGAIVASVSGGSCVYTSAAGVAAGTVVGTETITIPAAATNGTAVAQTASTCTTPPAAGTNVCPAGTTIAGPAAVTVTGTGAAVSSPSATLPALTAANFTKTCAPTATGVAATPPTATYPIVTTCTLAVAAGVAGGFPAGATVVSDTITAPNATFSCNGTTNITAANIAPSTCDAFFVGLSVCTNAAGSFSTLGGATITCQLPTITVTAATSLSECVTVGIPGDAASNQTVCGVAPAGTPFPGPTTPPTVAAQASSATLACGAGATPISVGGTVTLATVTGAATNCTVTVSCVIGGVTTRPCADGNVSVDLQGPNLTGILTCGTASNGAALQPCSATTGSNALNIPCGPTAPNGTTVSNNCTSVNFNVQSALAACLANPLNGCAGNLNSSNGCVSILLDYEATEGNGGSSQVFGTFSVCFPPPTLAALIVGCTPATIPSNGTLASVCTAQFANTVLALNNGVNIVPGVNQAAFATTAFLPGTFTVTVNGEAILDNGRQQESIPCGTNGLVNGVTGIGSLGTGFNNITPVTFSCTGVSFLAIGNGAAGEAAINVTYQSAVGGFQAVGSTLIEAVPSGAPRISLSCINPTTGTTTIYPFASSTLGAGAVCTAQVTDQNGVPLSGITGAGVTFTVSNPALATVIPCSTGVTISTGVSVGIASCGNVGTLGPTALVGQPSQTFTVNGGFAQAVVVANPNATSSAGQTITVTASLGVFVPPQFLCFLGGTSLQGVALPTNCNSATGLNGTGFSVGLNPSALGFGGTIALPNSTSASATLTIGANATVSVISPTSTSQVGPGCVQVIVNTAANTPVSALAKTVTPANALISIWRFNNTTKLFQAGFFSDPNAPTDFTLTNGGTETYFYCLQAAATIASA